MSAALILVRVHLWKSVSITSVLQLTVWPTALSVHRIPGKRHLFTLAPMHESRNDIQGAPR